MFTPGDVDDRKPLEYKPFIKFIYGKLVGDKGYISQNLFERLFVDGIQLITKLKSNMKGTLMSVSDRVLSGIAAYCFFPKKPAIYVQKVPDNQFSLF